MKNGWWRIEFRVTVDGIDIDFDELPVETRRKVMKQISQGAVAGALEMEEEK